MLRTRCQTTTPTRSSRTRPALTLPRGNAKQCTMMAPTSMTPTCKFLIFALRASHLTNHANATHHKCFPFSPKLLPFLPPSPHRLSSRSPSSLRTPLTSIHLPNQWPLLLLLLLPLPHRRLLRLDLPLPSLPLSLSSPSSHTTQHSMPINYSSHSSFSHIHHLCLISLALIISNMPSSLQLQLPVLLKRTPSTFTPMPTLPLVAPSIRLPPLSPTLASNLRNYHHLKV